MMFKSIRSFFASPVFEDEDKTREAYLLNFITLMYLAVIIIGATVALLSLAATATFDLSWIGLLGIRILPVLIPTLIAQILLRARYVRLGSYIFSIALFIGYTYLIFVQGGVQSTTYPSFMFIILLFGLLIGNRAAVAAMIASVILGGIVYSMQNQGTLPSPFIEPNILLNWITYSFVFLNVTGLLYLFLQNQAAALEKIRTINSELQKASEDLEQRVIERTVNLEKNTQQIKHRASQLEAIANTAHTATTEQKLERLLPSIARDISARFGFYHVGIFLLDTNKDFAILQATNSEGGQKMLARRHRLKVGTGLVGTAAQTGKPRIALDVGSDAAFFDNPELPDTHSEVALPLRFGNEIIGALDIQSTESNAFSQDDVQIFSVLADQVSVAIQNTRSLEQAQQALRDAEIATRQATGRTWEDFTEKVETKGYRYDGIKPEPLKAASKTQDQKDANSVPVKLRGQTIGRLKLRASDSAHKWTDDELAIVESTAERVAIALEGARLLEDAQKRASRESFLSEIASKLGASFQLDSILRDTVEELGQTLKGSKVTFQLVNPSSPPVEDTSNAKSTRGTKSE